MKTRPYVLSIAGHDPSGGAGLLADIKTFEAYKTLGLGVATAITYQTEDSFLGVDWFEKTQIEKQLDPLLQRYRIDHAKIGLIENLETLAFVVDRLKQQNSLMKIIWDPILSSSTGFSFHDKLNIREIEKLASELFMITPNLLEIKALYPDLDPLNATKYLAEKCRVYLKGGHDSIAIGKDRLIQKGEEMPYKARKISPHQKHGTGCILSASIAAGLAKGYPLHKAILKGKQYVTNVLHSNKTLLGYHKN